MSRFDACLAPVLRHEAGYVDNPHDNGGPTNLGVTIGTLSRHLGRPATKADIKALTPAKVAPIYEADFWREAACDKLPRGLDYMIFDTAVLSSPGRAKRFLQRAVGVTDDGIVGPATLKAVASRATSDVIATVYAARRAHFRSLDDFKHFGKGWMRRLDEVMALSLSMARGGL